MIFLVPKLSESFVDHLSFGWESKLIRFSSTGRYEIPNFIANQPIALQLNHSSLKGTLSCNEAQCFTATEPPHIAAATIPGTSRKRIA
ncbi:hypothetical protein CEXT_380561 [Caerostris extrusa]|uniref:Uncharacterized protein n=1 Tax=Caerostris extrusa TaxID=172846 RepID=A0AAV4SJ55_CAEEX|nr:hypothetical protein CEXT_380561 [Caerostris extrusa]